MNNIKYKLVLGLEIHLHLKTKTKMFCGCDADIYTSAPNTHTCPVCLGLPGALPVPNFDAVQKAQTLGLALNCSVNTKARFDRKHYFYPDLPKGYQISQYKQPFSENGYLFLDNGKKMEIERVHLEEDTAKSFHQGDRTLIDFNKSGMPLVEIVTRPVFTSVEEAVEFCKKIQTIVRFLEIGDVDMEKGQMRLEANISLRTEEMETAGELPKYKVEIKNINSFKFMEKAVNAEIIRQTELLSKGEQILQENRGFNEATGKTVSQRTKEEAHDYRYFPEPDIPPMEFDLNYVNNLKQLLPELPYTLVDRLIKQYTLDAPVAAQMVYAFGKDMTQKFEDIVKALEDPKKTANNLLNKKEYTNLSAKEYLEKVKQAGDKVTDTKLLREIITKVVENNQKAAADYKNGNLASLEYILGMVMRETKGKADPTISRQLIEQFFE